MERLMPSRSSKSRLTLSVFALFLTLATITSPALSPNALAGSSFARAYAISPMDNTVSVIDTSTFSVVSTIAVSPTPLAGVASPDGATLYVASYGFVSVIDTAAGAVTKTLPLNAVFLGLLDAITPQAAAITPDGSRVYITGKGGNSQVSVIDTHTNSITAMIPFGTDFITAIAISPDGKKAYVVDGNTNLISIIDTATDTIRGTVDAGSFPTGIAFLPDGTRAYITRAGAGKVAVLDTIANAIVANIPVGVSPLGVAVTPDGKTVYVGNADGASDSVSVVTTKDNNVAATIPGLSGPQGIAITPDGAYAFVANLRSNSVTVINTNTNAIIANISGIRFPQNFSVFMGPARDKLLGAAVLPSSRSVQVGSVATIFGTIINSGPGTASNCRIAPATAMPGTFAFQTTDAATNGLTGTANTPVAIPQGGAQSFLLAFTPSAPFAPTDVALNFSCSNAVAATSYSGINTLLLSASTTPVPDIVAIAATATNDGTLHIPGAGGSAALAVAIANVGSGGALIAQADTGPATLPLTLTLCQTNPATGACFSSPSASVPATVNGNATATYSIFATAKGAVPFSPAVNRLFIRFVDGGGVTRGSTSVAVQTQ
jgi:YVTN family beta-propeller protein